MRLTDLPVDVLEVIARRLPDASSRFLFLFATGLREVRGTDSCSHARTFPCSHVPTISPTRAPRSLMHSQVHNTILTNKYTFEGAAFVVREDRETVAGKNPPRQLLEAAGHLEVHGNAFSTMTQYPTMGNIPFYCLQSLSLHNVHLSTADTSALSHLTLQKLSLFDSQLDESLHDLLHICQLSLVSLTLKSVLCCCGAWWLGFRRGEQEPMCSHETVHLKHLALLGNLRCASRTCTCCITGDSVTSLHLAKPDDSIVEARDLRGVRRFRGAWSKSWMLTPRAGDVGADTGDLLARRSPLESLDVEGDIDADDLLAILITSKGTLRHVRIGGEVRAMTLNSVGVVGVVTRIMARVAELAKGGCEFQFTGGGADGVV